MSSTPEVERRIWTHLVDLQKVLKIPRKAYGKALGVGVGQISKRFKGQVRISSRDTLLMLEVMEVEAGEFFAGVYGDFHAELYLARLEWKNRQQVKYGKHDLMRDPPSRYYEPSELSYVAEGLQELRLIDAEAAKAQALDILRADFHYQQVVDSRAQVLARIALGAIFRRQCRYSRAAFFLRTAIRLAASDESLRGQVLQAVMSLAMDQGDFASASDCAESAICHYARTMDLVGLGRAFVSKGVLHVNLTDYEIALEAYETSLSFLPEKEWYGRFAALQGQGLCHIYEGRVDEALRFANLAVTALDANDVPPVTKAEAWWLRGEILLKMNSPEGVAELNKVLEIQIEERLSAIDLALISLRLVWVYEKQGDAGRLRELTDRVIPILKEFRNVGTLFDGVVAELLGVSLSGELSLEILQSVYRKMLKSTSTVYSGAWLAFI